VNAPERVVQAQLDAYNARDIDRFVACYAPGVLVLDLDSGSTRIEGLAAFRELYQAQFERYPLQRASLVSRQVCGAFVIDLERVRGNPDRPDAEVLAVYRVDAAGLIDRVQFSPRVAVSIAPHSCGV
jgi:hypothetical protein